MRGCDLNLDFSLARINLRRRFWQTKRCGVDLMHQVLTTGQLSWTFTEVLAATRNTGTEISAQKDRPLPADSIIPISVPVSLSLLVSYPESLATWDGNGDPLDGWVRAYSPFYRRRPNGDRTREYVSAMWNESTHSGHRVVIKIDD
jgi:hypothetical protein